MNNVKAFLSAQDKVNREIDEFGSAREESAAKLDELGDALSPAEVDEVCSRHRDDGFYGSLSDEEIDEMADRQRAESLYQRSMSHY